MSNTHTPKKKSRRLGHIAKFLAIHAGIILLLETDIAVMSASVLHSGGGAFLTSDATHSETAQPAGHELKVAEALHGAAQDALNTVITSQFVTSILFVVLGFFLHMLWVSHRNGGERPVRVTEKKKQRKEPAWYWMEIRI